LRAAAANPEEAVRLSSLADAWEAETQRAFLQGYRDAAGEAQLFDALDPKQGLLGLFMLDKALYELRYELGNRPDWLTIPLRGLLDILGLPHSQTAGVAER
jgi:maltose alpha-D-glucosyltransferase/alpha-amylase